MNSNHNWFSDARYGMFVHYGLYSQLGRGEWAMNREGWPRAEYRALAGDWAPDAFDADAICDLAVRAGMRYLVLTTMHHDGFRLYDTELSDFNSMAACGRDLVAETVAAAQARGLKIGLYHSLNNWMDTPDGVDALEDASAKQVFIDNTFARLRELVTRFKPIDVLWYDGWWPFDALGWEAERMNAELRQIQPHLLFNGRNGLPGDFATPEGHLSAPNPWRPWEACLTLNENWGFHAGDAEWKSPAHVIAMLATCAQGQGNLLLNIGPRGDGSIPDASVEILETVGAWLHRNGEAIYQTERFDFDLQSAQGRGDWSHNGPFTASGDNLYQIMRRWPGETLWINGLSNLVKNVRLLSGESLAFEQTGARVRVSLPTNGADELCPVVCFECDGPPVLTGCGGMRVPHADYPRYDPCESDIQL